MANTPDFDIRYTVIEDTAYLKKWILEERMLHWFPMSEGKELDDAIQCWIGFSKYLASLTVIIEDVPCAIGTLFLMPYRKVAHHCLFKMIVDPKYQRLGIGTALLKNLKHLAKTRFNLELMHIEIFEGNPIIHLLHKAGFKEFATQEKFVKEGDTYMGRILLECYL